MQITRPIYTGNVEESLAELIQADSIGKTIILCDSNTAQHCRHKVGLPDAEVIVVPAGEENKNLGTAENIWQKLLASGIGKNDCLINLGGGMVCDLGGFAASVFRRGIPFIHIPTTLLAMADASIGGKTGVDFQNLKNYLGTFSQPKAILISDTFLETLDENEIRSAWAEVIKTAVVADSMLFEMLEQPFEMSSVIRKCAEAKYKIVSADPYDRVERQLLNFGHTIGHALESYRLEQKQPVRHGDAVAAGMHAELKIACALGLISEPETLRIHNLIQKLTDVKMDAMLPLDEIMVYMTADKKNLRSGVPVFSLPLGIGKAQTGISIRPEQLLDMKNQGIL